MKIAITGAGIAGLTAAIALKESGFEADVFEAAPSLEPVGAGLGLAPNALKALAVLNLDHKVRAKSSRMDYFELQKRNGSVITKMSGRDFGENLCIHRAALHSILLAELGTGRVFTGKKAVNVTRKDNGIVLEFADGTTHEADCLIIADGINSQLRSIVAPQAEVVYAGYTCWRGVINNPGIKVKGAIEVLDVKGRFGYVPLPDNKIYWFACINAPKGKQLSHFTLTDLQQHFAGHNKAVTSILSHADPDALIYDDINDMKPLDKYAYDKIVIIGDAAHASTPNMGQGACMALEDAVILARRMGRNASVSKAFRSFEAKRLKRTHFIMKQSRMMGRLAHLQNPLLAALRNIVFKFMPKSIRRKQFKKLYKIDF